MGFSDSQMRALARSVPARHVKSRVRDGKELSYVEGWYVLAQANRIFGFDGWDRETIETKCLLGREARGSFTAVYSARVRITVRTPDGTVIRDGHGTGEAHGGSVGEVHDRALKAAETDATKRALATFGKAFGLALYVGRASVPTQQHPQNHTAQTAQASPAHRSDGGQRTNGGQPAQATTTLLSPDRTAGDGHSERSNGDAQPAIAATAPADATALMSTGRIRTGPPPPSTAQSAAAANPSTRVLCLFTSHAASATRSICATSRHSRACSAAPRRPTRTMSASPSHAPWAAKSATSSPSLSAAPIIANSTTAATKPPGGTTWASIRSTSRSSCGARPMGRDMADQLWITRLEVGSLARPSSGNVGCHCDAKNDIRPLAFI